MAEEVKVEKARDKLDFADRISQLPRDVICSVLSCLTPKEIGRTGCLSKTWRHTWSSFPIFAFRGDLLGDNLSRNEGGRCYTLEAKVRNQEYMKFVDDSLLNLEQKYLCLDEFKVVMPPYEDEFASHIDRWIEFLSNMKKLKKLQLSMERSKDNKLYTIPMRTWMISESLVVLRLTNCKLEKASFGNGTRLASLEEVYLEKLDMDDEITQMIILSIPYIRILEFLQCRGLRNLHITSLSKLEHLKVDEALFQIGVSPMETITVDAESLQSLLLAPDSKTRVDILPCKNLRELDLIHGRSMDGASLDDICCKFPKLHKLKLQDFWVDNLQISSKVLTSLEIGYDALYSSYWTSAQIDAPNLQSFVFIILYHLPLDSLSVNIPSQCEVDIRLVGFTSIPRRWFLKLRKFLSMFGPNTTLDLYTDTFRVESITEELAKESMSQNSTSRPVVLKRLQVETEIPFDKPRCYHNLVDGLLWTCHPKTLKIEMDPYRPGNYYLLLKNLCLMLINREGSTRCCSNFTSMRCWVHFLKGHQITRVNDGKIFDCNSLLEFLPARNKSFCRKKSLWDQDFLFHFEWSPIP